jgi:hypothetical protein
VNKYDGFCRGIDDGFFDEANAADQTARQRLIAATDPFVHNGQLTREQQQTLLQRLDERRKKLGKKTGPLKPEQGDVKQVALR